MSPGAAIRIDDKNLRIIIAVFFDIVFHRWRDFIWGVVIDGWQALQIHMLPIIRLHHGQDFPRQSAASNQQYAALIAQLHAFGCELIV